MILRIIESVPHSYPDLTQPTYETLPASMGDPKWKNLRGLYSKLVSVRVSGTLLDRLVDEGLFNLNERQEVDSVSPAVEDKKARRMIDILRHKPHSFDRFCLILKELGHEELAEKLLSGGCSALLVDSGALPICDKRVDPVASESVSVGAVSEQLGQRSQASEEVLTDVSVVETGGHGPSIREMTVSNSQLQASSPWSILTEPDIVIEFCTCLGFDSNFLSGLQEAKIINSEEYLEILNDGRKPREFKLKLLLNKMLPLCSSNQFFMFCEILKKTHRNQLSAELMKRASRMGWPAFKTGQSLPQVMAEHATEGDIEDANTDVKSDDERTVFVTVVSKFQSQYKRIHNEVEYMIEKNIHPKDKTFHPLKIEAIFPKKNPYDMEEEWQYDGPQFVERTAVKFAFPAVSYEEGSEKKKALLVQLLSRNIGLSKDEIKFVGGYPNGLAYVITISGDAALRLFCLLKDPLPKWPFDSFGPVKVKFHGLPSDIEMKFHTSKFVFEVYQSNQNMTARSMKLRCSLLMLKQQLDKCFKDVDHVDEVLCHSEQELNRFQANVRDYKGMNELKCKSLNEVVKSHLNVIVMVSTIKRPGNFIVCDMLFVVHALNLRKKLILW